MICADCHEDVHTHDPRLRCVTCEGLMHVECAMLADRDATPRCEPCHAKHLRALERFAKEDLFDWEDT